MDTGATKTSPGGFCFFVFLLFCGCCCYCFLLCFRLLCLFFVVLHLFWTSVDIFLYFLAGLNGGRYLNGEFPNLMGDGSYGIGE